MDISTAAASPIIRSIDGIGDVTFLRISTRELAAYGAEIKDKRRTRAIADAKEAQLPPAQAFRAINESAFGEVSLEEIADYVDSPSICPKIIEQSLAKAKRSDIANQVIDSFGPVELRLLVRHITGTIVYFPEKKPPDAKPADTKPDPASGFGAPGGAPPLT